MSSRPTQPTPDEARTLLATAIAVTIHATAMSVRDPDDPAANRARSRAGFMLADALGLGRAQPSSPDSPTRQPPATGRVCHRCAQVHVPPDTPCERPADPAAAQAGLAAARAALRDQQEAG